MKWDWTIIIRNFMHDLPNVMPIADVVDNVDAFLSINLQSPHPEKWFHVFPGFGKFPKNYFSNKKPFQ